ncbi:hypothetical protein [Pseudoalteromonas phage Pq0]|uniref:hypothetical protein n=1 Tax=Pseudoalteromonas phage Pq0 TaxID=1667322 RepID=UPI00065547E6|nr:hypothetical protein AXI74_gp23 [Pseudoalteromonas phage Pq0]AKN44306.1 hypothetical protein [Pseudoalteromonas phage Pq0]
MSTIKPIKVEKDSVSVNIHVMLDDERGLGYETTMHLIRNECGGWSCNVSFNDMPPQETFEAAIDRMKLYLQKYQKALNGKNFKHLNPDEIFKIINK